MRLWAAAASSVIGALAGFVGYFLWFFTPSFPSDEWSVMIGGALVGLVVGIVGTRGAGRRKVEVDDDTPWPGAIPTQRR